MALNENYRKIMGTTSIQNALPRIDVELQDCSRRSLDAVLKACAKLASVRIQTNDWVSLPMGIHVVEGDCRTYRLDYLSGLEASSHRSVTLSQQRVNALRPTSVIYHQ